MVKHSGALKGKKISLAILSEMYEHNLADKDWEEIDAILTHINKHHSKNEKGRALFKRIEDGLFQNDLSSKITLRT